MIYALWQLQEAIYEKLINDNELSKKIKGVYTHVPQDTKYPYVYLGKSKLKDFSTKTTKGLQIILDIAIYTNENGNRELISIMEKIEKIISGNLILPDYCLTSSKLRLCRISQETNLTHCLTAQFYIKLMEKNYGSV
jgi:uncharacterized protein DUF3168